MIGAPGGHDASEGDALENACAVLAVLACMLTQTQMLSQLSPPTEPAGHVGMHLNMAAAKAATLSRCALRRQRSTSLRMPV